MRTVAEVYLADPGTIELRPFQDRVLELVRLFHSTPAVRLRIVGTIAAGEPIDALEDEEYLEVHGPAHSVQRRGLLPGLRGHLCPALQRVSADAFEIARVITPLLVGLKMAGKVPFELDPWIFAGIALLIERMGVSAFCAEPDAGTNG